MRTLLLFVTALLALLASAPSSRAVTVPFSSPPFTHQFIINQPGNIIDIRYPGITNIYYIPGTDAYISNQAAYFGTNNFSGGGGGGSGTITNGVYVNTGPDTAVVGGQLNLNTNKFLAPVDSRAFTNLNTGFNEIDGQLLVKKSVGIGLIPDIVLNADGSAQFDSGNVTISLAGNVGAISFSGDGSPLNPATTIKNGVIKPDGSSITIDLDGTIHAPGAGGGTITALTGGVTASGSGSVNSIVNWVNPANGVYTTNFNAVGGITDTNRTNGAFTQIKGGSIVATNPPTTLGMSYTNGVFQVYGDGSSNSIIGNMRETNLTSATATDGQIITYNAAKGHFYSSNAPAGGGGGGGLSNQLAGAIQHLAFNIITNITPGNGSGLAVGDMNTDGIPDIVVDINAATVVYTNIRNGTLFPRASTFAQTSTAGGVALADVDANGTLDAIASSRTGNYINVLTNAGDGTLTQLGGNYTFGSGGPNFIIEVTGKIDNNSSYDFVAINGAVSEIFTNDGIGNFAVSTNLPAPVATASGVAMGDLNGNGTNDLAFSCGSIPGHGIVTMTNDGLGHFLFYSTNNVSNSGTVQAVAIGDFNGDGRNDIAFAEAVTVGSMQIFTNNGTGFGLYSSNVVDNINGSASLTVADFNQDGKLDIVESQTGTFDSIVFTNAGYGHGMVAAYTNVQGASAAPWWTGTADFNGDGWPDYAVYNTSGSGGVNVLLNTPNIVGNHFGDGSHLTNGQISFVYNSSVVTPANAWTPGPPAASGAPFGTATINTNYLPYLTTFAPIAVIGNGLNLTNISFCTTSASSSGTVTSLNTHQIEMTYMSSGSTIVSLTWALPTSTTLGKIFYLHSKSAITTLTVTGGSFIDAAVVTMTAGQTIGFETIDGGGNYIRLQ